MDSKENSINKRLDYIDLSKGIAILIVVYYHIAQDRTDIFSNWCGCVMIPLFFVCTGYLTALKEREQSFKDFIIKNLKGIMYPYLTFSLIAYAFYSLWNIAHGTFELSELLSRVKDGVLLFGYSVLWFLPTLFFAKTVYYIICKNKALLAVFGVAAIVLSSGYSVLYCEKLNDTFLGDLSAFLIRILLGVLFISFGAFLNGLLKKGIKTYIISLLCLIASVLLMVSNPGIDFRCIRLSCGLNGLTLLSNPLCFFAAAFLSCFAVICGFYCINDFAKYLKPLSFFGKNSLCIFATHTTLFVIYIPTLVLTKLHITPVLPVVFVSAVLIETVIVLVINRFLPFLIKYPKKQKTL